MKCNTLEDMKKQIAYRQDDDSDVVKAGIQGNVDYIFDLLKQKCIDGVKTKNLSASNARFCSLSQLVVSTQFVLQDTSTTATTTINWSIDYHRVSLIDSVSQWRERNKKELNLDGASLIEGQHYQVSILNDSLDGFAGKIKCSCGKVATLIKNREKFQLSNFYCHIADRRNGKLCDMVQKVEVHHQRDLLLTLTQQTTEQIFYCLLHAVQSATATPMTLPSTPLDKRKEISTTQSQSTTRKPLKRVRMK